MVLFLYCFAWFLSISLYAADTSDSGSQVVSENLKEGSGELVGENSSGILRSTSLSGISSASKNNAPMKQSEKRKERPKSSISTSKKKLILQDEFGVIDISALEKDENKKKLVRKDTPRDGVLASSKDFIDKYFNKLNGGNTKK